MTGTDTAVAMPAPTTERLAGELRTEVNRLSFHFRTPAAHRGITPTRLAALSALARQPDGCRTGDLAAQMGVSPSSMTRLVEILRDEGWLERRRDPADQRAYHLLLTASGHERLLALREETTTRLASDIAELDPDQIDALVRAIPVLRELADRRLALDPATRAPAPATA